MENMMLMNVTFALYIWYVFFTEAVESITI